MLCNNVMLIMLFNSYEHKFVSNNFLCQNIYTDTSCIDLLALSRDNKGNYFKMLKRNSLLKIIIK